MDLTQSIEPKSDQLNAEDLLTGPRTFTIAEVKKGSDEQPVDVHLVENPGRPFKPSKTVRRLMVAAWGVDSATYAGHRMTLYRDPAVKFGGMDVGGIRVSHMSGIDRPLKIALAVSRGKRAPYVVQPLAETAPAAAVDLGDAPEALTAAQLKLLHIELNRIGKGADRDWALNFYDQTIGHPVESSKHLSKAEASDVIEALKAMDAPESGEQVDPT